jgi:hypothetical protein
MSTNEIAKFAENVHEVFSQVSVHEIFKIWFEQRNIPFSVSEESNETETITEFFNTNLTNVSTSELI